MGCRTIGGVSDPCRPKMSKPCAKPCASAALESKGLGFRVFVASKVSFSAFCAKAFLA